jgi:hypothetical protein
VEVFSVTTPGQVNAALDVLRARRQPRVFVLSGDGTMHAIAQYLALLPAGEWSPELLFLGGGRANVVPRDCGGLPALPRLEAALRACHDGKRIEVELLPLLRVEQDGAIPQHGFVFAGSLMDYGIRLCRSYRMAGTDWLHRGPLADPICLAKLGLQVLVGRNPLPASPLLELTTDSAESLRGVVRLLFASTLLHREGYYNPYAARGSGPVRVTAVLAGAVRFWRQLPGLIGGRLDNNMKTPAGYLSGRVEYVNISGLSGYSLDGEAFATDPSRPVRLCSGMRLRILRP